MFLYILLPFYKKSLIFSQDKFICYGIINNKGKQVKK